MEELEKWMRVCEEVLRLFGGDIEGLVSVEEVIGGGWGIFG